MDGSEARSRVERLTQQIETVIVGKSEVVERALIALFANGRRSRDRFVRGLLGRLVRSRWKVLAVYRPKRLGLLELMQRV